MRRFRLLALLLPILAACSCDETVSSAMGKVTADPSSLDFGGVFVASSSRLPVSFRNQGATTVTVTESDLPRGYSLDPAEVKILPGASTEAQIVFKPTEVQRYDGTLEFAASQAKNKTVEVAVLGEGLQRDLAVAERLDFGVVEVGKTSTLPLPITSESGGTVKATFVLAAGGTDYAIDLSDMELEPGESGELQVSFTPTSVGPLSDRIVIHTCTTCKDVIVQLTGEGGMADLKASPVSLDFGTISPGNRRVRTLELRNRGTIAITVAGAAFTADADFEADFSVFPVEIAGGDSVAIDVAFAPPEDVTPGAQASSIQFIGANDAVLVTVPTAGNAGGPDLIAIPENVDFGMQPIGLDAHRSVTITNVGDPADIRILSARIEGTGAAFYAETPLTALPMTLGDSALVFDVVFNGLVVGDHPAELVVSTTDDEQAEMRIPLLGHTRDLPPCDLMVRPNNIRFGLVEVGKEYVRDVEFENLGSSDCLVWDIGLDPNGSWMYQLDEPPQGTQLIPAGGVLTVNVKYQPQLLNDTVDTSALRYSHSTPETPTVSLPITGLAGRYQLVGTPIDFGSIPLGLRTFDAVTIRNAGANAAVVDHVSIAPGAPDFASHQMINLPGQLATGDEGQVQVSYKANDLGVDEGLLEVWLANVSEPFLVDMTGEGLDEECGDYCLGPQAICPVPQTTTANTEIPLMGAGTDPTGDPLTCQWTVTQRPTGSSVNPADPTSCVTTFRPDIVGNYTLELTVTDPMGNTATCTTQVTANPTGGLWIEMYWDTNNDIDLHLHNPVNGTNPSQMTSWFNTDDCYYGNCTPGHTLSWDTASVNDDPSLDRDDTQYTGPENTRISQPSTSHGYSIGVHYFSDGRTPGATVNVTVNVYCGGSLLHSSVTTIDDGTSADGDARDFIVLGEVLYSSTSACTWSANGTRLLY